MEWVLILKTALAGINYLGRGVSVLVPAFPWLHLLLNGDSLCDIFQFRCIGPALWVLRILYKELVEDNSNLLGKEMYMSKLKGVLWTGFVTIDWEVFCFVLKLWLLFASKVGKEYILNHFLSLQEVLIFHTEPHVKKRKHLEGISEIMWLMTQVKKSLMTSYWSCVHF